jgi:ectoine hydroxylase-related dioxygenase (phytanoyl-CoA dioxygenase family)
MGSVEDICVRPAQAAEYRARFQRDGTLIVKGAFDERSMQLIKAAFDGNLDNPPPTAQQLYPESGGWFIQSVEDSSLKPAFQAMYQGTPILDIVASVFGSDEAWHLEDQLFFKDGSTAPVRRTPWHQDTVYHPMNGEKIAVLWIPLQDVPTEAALEVVRGSHRGTLYNGSFFDAHDDTAPVYSEKDMPRLPNIQAQREAWDIITCTMQRGDVLVFHSSTLHGGGYTPAGVCRRSLSLRVIGNDVVRVARPKANSESPVTNNVGDEEIKVQSRLNKVALGECIHKCGLTRLSRRPN